MSTCMQGRSSSGTQTYLKRRLRLRHSILGVTEGQAALLAE